MAMFFPSTHPRLWRPCWNAWCQRALSDGERGVRTPMRRTFADGCASADAQRVRSMAQRVRTVMFLFMFFSALFTRHSSLALFSLDDFVRPIQHGRWNRQTDLLGGFQIDDEFELCRLFDGKIGGLCAFQDSVHVRGGPPEYVWNARAIGH